MRRTGQNPRRTGQRDENGGENESGFFRQEDPPTKKQLRRDEPESERRKTAAGSPKGERSESICRIHRKFYEALELTQHGMLIEL
jgi:hypothetical protein